MKRVLTLLLLSSLAAPVFASAQTCSVAEQQDPKALVNLFLQQEIDAAPRGEFVKWQSQQPGYKGSEYVYPIATPRLEQDSLTVIGDFKVKEIKIKGDGATAVVELFTIADVWRPKGKEEDAFGRRVTEIGEPLLQSYQLRNERGCWVLIDPPKPAVKAGTVLNYLEQLLVENRNQPADAVTPESRKRVYMLEREVPMLKNLIRKYVPGAGV
ncbi:MAG: hypothetical protein ACK4E7_09245 [Permianibacter sp.]